MQKLNPYIYLFSLGHFSVDWTQGALPALLPYFISVCHLNYREAGMIMFANILLSSLTQPIFGYYSDKISKPWFVPLAPIISGWALTVCAFTTNFQIIFLCSMFSGLGSALYHPEAALMVNKIAGEQKGKALGAFSVGGNAGFAIGPMLAGFCAYKFNIHGLALFGIINMVLAFLLYRSIGKLAEQKTKAEAEAKASNWQQTVPSNNWPAFAKLTPVIFARAIGFSLTNTFVPIYWMQVLHSTAANGSMALSVLFTLGIFMTYLGGVLADRFGYIKVMRIAFLVMVPAMLAFTNSKQLWLSLWLLLPVAFSLFIPYSSIVVLGQTYLGKSVGLASGITMGLGTTMGGMMSPLVGWGADQWGIGPALQILWVVALLGLAFAFLVPSVEEKL